MKTKILKFLPILFFLLSFSLASAEEAKPAPKSVTVATVNIQNAKLESQEKNNFKLSFDITNREGIQPSIMYAVSLAQKDSKGKLMLMDKKVYDKTLSLKANDSIHESITYLAPAYLQGKYMLFVEATNQDGLPLGTSPIDSMKEFELNGTNQYIQIDPTTCFLTINSEEKKYSPFQGVDVSKDENLIANCQIKSSFQADQTITPSLNKKMRTSFGKDLGTQKGESFTIKSNEQKDFQITLDKPTEPQAYNSILTFKNDKGENVSTPIEFHYVVQGKSATIQNITLDKDSYKNGETAKVSFFWSGSASSFPGSRAGNTEIAGASAALQIKGCSNGVKKELQSTGSSLENVSIPITSDCPSPTVDAIITDKDGKVLAKSSYSVSPKNTPEVQLPIQKEIKQTSKIILIVLAITIVLLIILLAVLIKRRNMGLGIFFFLLMVGIMFGGEVKADTFVAGGYYTNEDGSQSFSPYWGSGNGNWTYTVNIDKSQYYAGENAFVTASVYYSACGNYDAQSKVSVNLGLGSVTVIDTMVVGGGTYWVNNVPFTISTPTPSTIGSYTANFTMLSGNVNGSAQCVESGEMGPCPVYTNQYQIPFTTVAAPIAGQCGNLNGVSVSQSNMNRWKSMGDMNSDGIITNADATAIQNVWMSGIYDQKADIGPKAGTGINSFLASDGQVNVSDVTVAGNLVSGVTSDGYLCSAGNHTAVNGSGPWSWTCPSPNGGTTANCGSTCATTCPDPATICQGQSAGPNGCGGTCAVGTKTDGSCCIATTWTPGTDSVCTGQSFTQTSNCSTTKIATGTKNCTPSADPSIGSWREVSPR